MPEAMSHAILSLRGQGITFALCFISCLKVPPFTNSEAVVGSLKIHPNMGFCFDNDGQS